MDLYLPPKPAIILPAAKELIKPKKELFIAPTTIVVGYGAGAATVDLVDNLQGAVSKSCSLGTSVAGRKIVYICAKDADNNNVTVTVDGNSMTKIGYLTNSSESITAFYYDLGAGVTSGTIAVSNGGTTSRHLGAVFAIYGAATGTAAATATDTSNANPTTSLTVTANGVGVGLVYHRVGGSRTYAWSGLTLDFESALLNSAFDGGAASAEFTSGGSQAITVTPSSSGVRDPILYTAAFSKA